MTEPAPPIETAPQHQPSLAGSALAVGGFVLLLWAIWAADAAFHLHLYRYGVYPREVWGLVAILVAPLVHGSWTHLFANTLPVFVLGIAVVYGYPSSARIVIPVVYLASGLGVWLFGRPSYHVGASGLAHGLMFFVLVVGILRRDRRAIALSLLVFFLYGGMVWTILPTDPHVSFEYHLFGALSGLVLAIALRHRDPPPPEKRYSWEEEPEDGGDDAQTDAWRTWHTTPAAGGTAEPPAGMGRAAIHRGGDLP
jgi:membrane associated rhomboid family serine protease